MTGARISRLERQREFPAEVPWGEFEAAFMESPERSDLILLNDAAAREDAARCPRGTAFGIGAELRWWKRRTGLHLVLISDRGLDLGEQSDPNDLEEALEEPGEVLLWGERAEGQSYYYDSRIPKLLEYPISVAANAPAGTRLGLRLRHYWIQDGNPPVLVSRYAEFCVVTPPVPREPR